MEWDEVMGWDGWWDRVQAIINFVSLLLLIVICTLLPHFSPKCRELVHDFLKLKQ